MITYPCDDCLHPPRTTRTARHRRPRQRPPPTQHPLHHGRRSRRPRHLRLRQPHQPDAEHRPHRERRRSPLQLLLHQFHLHAQPRRHSHRAVQPQKRRLLPRRTARPQAQSRRQGTATRRLPDRDDRQMAPRQRAHRLRLLEHPSRPGRLSRSRLHHPRRTQEVPRLLHRPDRRFHPRLAQTARPEKAVLRDVPPQSAAPPLGARPTNTRTSSRTATSPSPTTSSTTTKDAPAPSPPSP